MRKVSLPLGLAALGLLLVLGSKAGVTGEQVLTSATNLLEVLLRVCWPVLAVLAWVLWLRGRQPAAAAFAVGLTVQAVSHLGLLPRLALVRLATLPVYFWALALAVIWWSGGTARSRPVLVGLVAIVTVFYWTAPLTVRAGGGWAVMISAATVLYWLALTVSAWAGWRRVARAPLRWLICLGAVGFTSVLVEMIPVSPGSGVPLRTIYDGLSVLVLAMAAGVVASGEGLGWNARRVG